MSAKELPDLIREFIDMAKAYLRQETVEPAKRLGRVAGFSMAGALLLTLAAIPLAVAGMRLVIDLLPGEPHHRMWSGLGYVLSGFGLLIVAGLFARAASR